MQVKYINDSQFGDVTFSTYAVIDGQADNAYHLFTVYVNVDELTIYVRNADGTGPLIATTGKASTINEFVTAPDGSPVGMVKRVTGPSVASYVGRRAGRLTAQVYSVGMKVEQASA
jgi:hypothetical protein